MSDKPFCIFVVDDDSLMRMVVCDQLQGNNYQVHEFANGEACLSSLDLQPNLILLDVEMPGKSGLDICREIRALGYADIQVMFVTAHDDLDTLLTAFEVGGNDFIPKNAKKDVLLRKVDIAVETETQKQKLKLQLSYAQQTAFTAMSSLGETGTVLEFLRASFDCRDLKQLGHLLVETLHQFSVKGLVKLTDLYGEFECGSDIMCTSLEQSILGYAAKLGRISQTGDRLVFNFPHITILIVGLNAADSDAIGRMRDHLAIVAEGAGVRIEAMNNEQERLHQANARIEDAKELANLLSDIESFQHDIQRQIENLVEQHRLAFEHAFIGLGLTDAQEILLDNIINQLTTELDTLFESDNKLALRLKDIVNKQKQLLQTQ